MTKVMVGIPSPDYCHIQFATSLAMLIAATSPTPQLYLASGSVCHARNTLVHMAQRDGFDWMLMIDNDMSFPPFALTRMLAIADQHELDVLGCNYLFKKPPHTSMMTTKNRGAQHLFGLDEVDRLPTGMMLIRVSIFEKLKTPYFILEPVVDDYGVHTIGTEDYQFCDRAREAGVKIMMDTRLSFAVIHWGSPCGVRWIRQPPGYQVHADPLDYTRFEEIGTGDVI